VSELKLTLRTKIKWDCCKHKRSFAWKYLGLTSFSGSLKRDKWQTSSNLLFYVPHCVIIFSNI
jgi:hypothetical protein